MTKRLTTWAASPLGRWIALVVVAASLVYVGCFMVTDGTVNLKLQAFLKTLSAPEKVQQSAKDLMQGFSDHFRKYDRVQQITYFGMAIVAGFFAANLAGMLLRSYRFRFLPETGELQRQEMWLCMPVWLLTWLVLGALIVLITGLSKTVAFWMPLSLLLTLAVPPAMWLWFPDAARRWVPLPPRRLGVRFPLWLIVWIMAAVVMLLARLVVGIDYMVQLPMPLALLLAAVLPPLALLPAWFFFPRITRRCLFIPGLRWRRPFSRIRRMEVQSRPEGGSALVVIFGDESSWTLATSTPRRLERLGRVAARVAGLERRDLMTWA